MVATRVCSYSEAVRVVFLGEWLKLIRTGVNMQPARFTFLGF